VIRLDEKVESFEALKEDVQNQLLQQRKNESFESFVTDLMDQSDIENFVRTEEEKTDDQQE